VANLSWATVTLQVPVADDLADFLAPIGIAVDIVGTIVEVAGGIVTVAGPLLSLLTGTIPLPSTEEIVAALVDFLLELLDVEVAAIHHYPCKKNSFRSFASWKEDIAETMVQEWGNECISMDGFSALLLVVTANAGSDDELRGAVNIMQAIFGLDCIPEEDDNDLLRLPSLDFLRRFHCLPFGDVIPAVGELTTTMQRAVDAVKTAPSEFSQMIALGLLLVEKGRLLQELADLIDDLVDLLRILAAGVSVALLSIPLATGASEFGDLLANAENGPDQNSYAGGTVLLVESGVLAFLDLLLSGVPAPPEGLNDPVNYTDLDIYPLG